jgi:hypothetical protein
MLIDIASDNSNNRGDRKHVKITQTIPEQYTRKAQNLGITQNNCIRHYKHTMENANVKVQNIFHQLYNITCSTNCKYRTAAKQKTLETRFVSDM